MGLDFNLLTVETGFRPKANILGQTRPHELGGQEPPRSMHSRVQETMKSKEQLIAKRGRNQRSRRSGGHITDDRGLEKRNRDHGEGRIGDHELYERASGLQGREGREIETGGREIKRNGEENRYGGF